MPDVAKERLDAIVALRKESVDRNRGTNIIFYTIVMSLSARRAWIEIPAGCWRDARRAVALRKESVDRNRYHRDDVSNQCVALRKESVDRNRGTNIIFYTIVMVALRKESVDRNAGQ